MGYVPSMTIAWNRAGIHYQAPGAYISHSLANTFADGEGADGDLMGKLKFKFTKCIGF